MSHSLSQHSASISVTDFGPIAEADVALRPLTIFVGPSNTGKSYLAILIHTLSNYLDGTLRGYRHFGFHFLPERRRSRAVLVPPPSRHPRLELSAEQKDELVEWIKEHHDKPTGQLPNLPSSIEQQIKNDMGALVGDAENISPHFQRCFGLRSIADLTRLPSPKPATISLSFSTKGRNAGCLDMTFGTESLHSRFATAEHYCLERLGPPHLPNTVLADLLPFRIGELEHSRSAEEKQFWITHAYNTLLGLHDMSVFTLGNCSHYLPADRTGIMHAHRIVVGALVQQASYVGIHYDNISLPSDLSGVMADFLNNLITIDSEQGQFSKYGNSIEQTLLGGTIQIDRSKGTGYPSFFYLQHKGKNKLNLPLVRSSSMISELAPVVLYLRHVVRKNDLLIIEEPEAHLHPEKQAAFANQIAKLVNAGLRVIVTTHSEWLMERISNLIQFSRLSDEQRTKFVSSDATLQDAALVAEQVGAWRFREGKNEQGSTVSEIPVDPETGIMPQEYTDVSLNLYREWQTMTEAERSSGHES